MKGKDLSYKLIFILALAPFLGFSQINQDFNQSVNQIGDCWQKYNMYIETQNTLNKANERKALTGSSPVGNPAYHFTSPIIEFGGNGSIEFRHKMSDVDGNERVLTLYLLDEEEKVTQVVYSHVFRTGGTSPNGNPTNIINVSIPITWTGVFILRWEWMGAGGSSVGMIDDIIIDGEDMSDGSNDNGYGYCRPDDFVSDTVCAGTQDWDLKVPYVIQGSDWSWDFQAAASVGSIDTSIVVGLMDSMIQVDWNYEPGIYHIEATEIRPPHMTTSYSVDFTIYVLDYPSVSLSIDSICFSGQNTMQVEFTGTGPWELTYTDGTNTYNQVFSNSTATISLPPYSSTTNVSVTGLVDASGCSGDPSTYPTAPAVVYPRPSTGLIQY